MAENKLVRVISLLVALATFTALALFNHEWIIAPVLQNCGLVYELSEFTLLSSIITASLSTGALTEVVGDRRAKEDAGDQS